MPEFTVKEVRLPELHLPEIKRDEIVRALSGIRVPDVDLAKVEGRPRLPGFVSTTFPWRRRGLSGVDAGKLVAAAVTAARLVRPAASRPRWSPIRRPRLGLAAVIRPAPRRSRLRLAIIAVVVAAFAGWMVLRLPAVRAWLDRATARARQGLDAARAGQSDEIDLTTGEPASVATTTASAATGEDLLTADAEAVIAAQLTNPA